MLHLLRLARECRRQRLRHVEGIGGQRSVEVCDQQAVRCGGVQLLQTASGRLSFLVQTRRRGQEIPTDIQPPDATFGRWATGRIDGLTW